MHPEKYWGASLSVSFLQVAHFRLRVRRTAALRPFCCCQSGRVLFFALAAKAHNARSPDLDARCGERQVRAPFTVFMWRSECPVRRN
jgi:hypothetical protein